MHRFVLAEFNTHRVFSRNSASSRAIPVRKQLDKVRNDPAFPLHWGAEQAGMQSGDELFGEDLDMAQSLFSEVHQFTVDAISWYLTQLEDIYGDDAKKHTLHKSLLNRMLEPFMWHTVICTATEYQNFFNQRASEFSGQAQAEIRAPADAMLAAMRESEPQLVQFGEWHLPLICAPDWRWAYDNFGEDAGEDALKKISTARCARVSYLTHDGRRDPHEDLRLYERLVSAKPRHESPLEHPATPARQSEIDDNEVMGNLHGWHQKRHHP